jgi:hypothetical protein
MRKTIISLIILLAFVLPAAAQYQCDWNVFDAGGIPLSSNDFQAKVSISQTAIGTLTGTNYTSYIGFWQFTTQVAIEEHQNQMPAQNFSLITELKPAQPNPFSKETKIAYSLAQESDVSLFIYNTCGQMVKKYFNARQKPGNYSFIFRATDNENTQLARGVYFYEFLAGDYKRVKKLLLIR